MTVYRVYYGDGSSWDSWEDSPDVGVQLILVDDELAGPGYKTIIMGEDEYTDPTGESSKIKYGAWMPENQYLALVNRVLSQ